MTEDDKNSDIRIQAKLDLAALHRRTRLLKVARSSRALVWLATTLPFLTVVGLILAQIAKPWIFAEWDILRLTNCVIMMAFFAYAGWIFKATDRRINALVALVEETAEKKAGP